MARTAQKQKQRNSSNIEFTDREILANIQDVADGAGWATSTDIAIRCGFTTNGKPHQTPAIKVASRLSWMRSGGLLESTGPDMTKPFAEPGDRDTRWRLTPVGQQILAGSLTKAVSNAVEKMDPGAQVLLMRHITQQGWIEGELPVAFAIRREYQHNLAKRKIIFRINTAEASKKKK